VATRQISSYNAVGVKLKRAHWLAAIGVSAIALSGCRTHRTDYVDKPRIEPGVLIRDIVFRSRALNREMRYRVALPVSIPPAQRLAVVYLLHGVGGDYRDWTNLSDVAGYAKSTLILVMPQGDNSYYVNAVGRPDDRYEDYITKDLIADVEARFPAATVREKRAIAGISMGGFGAIKIGLSHPALFNSVAALSAAIDVPRRSPSLRGMRQFLRYRPLFGPWASDARKNRDPFLIARSTDPAIAPYIFLTCGDQDGFLPANREFAALLERQHLAHEFHEEPGGHDWNRWNADLPAMVTSLLQHLEGI
jgi:S-formylglutathione hydrolase FrmB